MIQVQTHPFPHAVIQGMWPDDLLDQVLEEFLHAEQDLRSWKHFHDRNQEKFEGGHHRFGSETRRLVQMIKAQGERLEEAFNLPPMRVELAGGGYHLIKPGGLLSVHTDFSISESTRWYRRLNLLVYLNKGWTTQNGGELELWDDQNMVVSIPPEFNTTAIFETSSRSWHGHPRPVVGRSRRSFAAYFYSEEPPPDFTNQSTVWHPQVPRR